MINSRKLFLIAALPVLFFIFPSQTLADDLGREVIFNVNPEFDKFKRTSLAATLRHISNNAYFYIDDSFWSGLSFSDRNSFLSNIRLLADAFDGNIYKKETDLWGSEPNPGIDADSHITILIEDLVQDNGGYFETANTYAQSQISTSNQREMLALNAEVVNLDLSILKMFLAHEFHHLISFNQKEKIRNVSEDIWLNELRAEYSISAVGYNDGSPSSNLGRRAYIFSNNQADSLTEWPNKNPDYAVVALFAEYLVEQFGTEILSESLKSSLVGIDSLNQYLLGHGHSNFETVFLNWLGALYLNNHSQYAELGYRRSDLQGIRIVPSRRISLSQSLNESSSMHYIKDWEPLWLEYNLFADNQGSLKIEVSGEAHQKFVASYLAFYGDGSVKKGKLNIIGNMGSGFVLDSEKELKKVVVLLTKSTKTSVFTKNEPVNFVNIKASLIDTEQARANTLEDGLLIKRPREKEIYVIWGKYKRYLNPEVISLYGHLNPNEAIELDPEIFDSYKTSNYVKYEKDEKVYAVWPDGSKHWLHITPGQWDASGRDWNAIFTINDLELNHYGPGAEITK